MSTDAVIRLRLDPKSAEATLDTLYKKMSSAPSLGVGGIAAGVLGGNLLTQGVNALTHNPLSRGLYETGRDALFSAAFGEENIGRLAGAMSSRQAVASRYGKLKAWGLVNDDFLKQMMALEEQYGAGAQASGEKQILGALGGEAAKEILDAALAGVEHLATKFIPRLAEAIGDAIARKLNPL